MSKAKIAFFLPNLEGGGAEKMVVNLAVCLRERNYAVDFVLVQAIGSLLEFAPSGVEIIDLHASRTLTAIPKLSRYLHQNQPEALIATPDIANLTAIWAKMLALARTKVVIGAHTNFSRTLQYTSKIQERVYPTLLRLFHRFADVIIAVSDGSADDLARITHIPREHIIVIYNPAVHKEIESLSQVPLEHPWFQPGNPPVILAAGRLNIAKDYPTLLHACALLRNRLPARLVILGEGDMRAELSALIERLKLTNEVDLPGFETNPYRFMARCHAFVLSSIYEGFPSVLAEALVCGAQVVSTDCPSGPAEILENGKYGRLVPMGDPQALAVAIEGALADPLPAEMLRARARMFSVEAATEKYLHAMGLD